MATPGALVARTAQALPTSGFGLGTRDRDHTRRIFAKGSGCRSRSVLRVGRMAEFFRGQVCWIFFCLGGFSATMGRKPLQRSHTPPLRIPMSQPSARGPLQRGRVSLCKWDTLDKMSATGQTDRQQNPNSRGHRGRCDYNRAVRTGGRTEFLRMPIPPA